MKLEEDPQGFAWQLEQLQNFGLNVVLTDSTLRVETVKGALADEWTDRQDLTGFLPFFVGLDQELSDLMEGRSEILEFPRLQWSSIQPKWYSVQIQARPQGAGLCILLQDVTKQAAAEQLIVQQRNELELYRLELEKARAAAEAANQAKTRFLAHVSHELKTPLSVISGNAEILSRFRFSGFDHQETLEKELREYAIDIRESASLLSELISDLLDISRAETGRFSIEEEEVALIPLVMNAIKSLRFLPNTRSPVFSTSTMFSDVAIKADPTRLRQILLNLLTNAQHASPAGGRINISIEQNSSQDIEIRIEDEGEGLAQEMIERVFEPFYTLSGGTGLGLTIAASLAELHGGSISLSNKTTGQGCVSRLTLPQSRILAITP